MQIHTIIIMIVCYLCALVEMESLWYLTPGHDFTCFLQAVSSAPLYVRLPFGARCTAAKLHCLRLENEVCADWILLRAVVLAW